MTVVVRDATRAGRASGRSALRTIVQVLPPIAWTASTSPPSTSRTDVSTSRAKNGMAPTASGTVAACQPIEVPTIARVNGISATIRITNGSERPMFTTAPVTLLTVRLCSRPPLPVSTSRMPSGRPSSTVARVARPTIWKVSRVAGRISSSIWSQVMPPLRPPGRARPPEGPARAGSRWAPRCRGGRRGVRRASGRPSGRRWSRPPHRGC